MESTYWATEHASRTTSNAMSGTTPVGMVPTVTGTSQVAEFVYRSAIVRVAPRIPLTCSAPGPLRVVCLGWAPSRTCTGEPRHTAASLAIASGA